MSQRRDAGLCYNCPAKYSREHMKECPGKGVYLLVADDEPPLGGDGVINEEDPHISLNAIRASSPP
jgi:hypothetical protein